MINKRISDLSCNENEFNKVKPAYETALRQSGYIPSMQYNSENTQNVRRKRNRKVIWFNPPYSQSVKTNIGKIFIKLVRKHFPKNSKYGKIFNLSTLKISYCCTTSIGNIIKQHNSKVLNTSNEEHQRTCNCRSKPPNCPLNNECLAQCIVYKAVSSTPDKNFVYCRTSEWDSKQAHQIVQKPCV